MDAAHLAQAKAQGCYLRVTFSPQWGVQRVQRAKGQAPHLDKQHSYL